MLNDYKVVRYSNIYYNEWNSFVSRAKNATFLFYRDYMEYHKDRFEDYSLMIFKGDKLTALLPANIERGIVYSHQGLTYGGLLLLPKISATKVFLMFEAVCEYLKREGFVKIQIKQIPNFYCLEPSFEIPYLVGKKGKLIDREMVLAIDYSKALNIHKTKKKHYKFKIGKFEIKENDLLSDFWLQVLEPVLKEKHNSKPVHSLSEIIRLKRMFPKQIIQYNIFEKGKLLAGITIFDKGRIVKSQYGAATPEGEGRRSLDCLFMFLIEKYKKAGKAFFSMGTVSNNSQLDYSEGMLGQKQELGCSVYLKDSFSISLA